MLEIAESVKVVEGESVCMKRIVPVRKHRVLNPFVRVDHFHIDHGGFPNQLHDGFEGLFYLFSGKIHHEDSLGNFFDIEAGGGELFTAGAGLIHKELVEDKAHGIRVWIDLGSHKKRIPASYKRFTSEEIPEEKNKSVLVRKILGLGSPLKSKTRVEVLDITMCSQSVYKYDIPEKFNGLVYVIVGSIKVKGQVIKAGETVYFKDDKDIAMLTNTGARVFLCFGEPYDEYIQSPQSYDTI